MAERTPISGLSPAENSRAAVPASGGGSMTTAADRVALARAAAAFHKPSRHREALNMPVLGDRAHMKKSVYGKVSRRLGIELVAAKAIDSTTRLAFVWEPRIHGRDVQAEKRIRRIRRRHKRIRLVNATDFDDDKRVVQEIFAECFGYSLGLDASSYGGMIVKKSRTNATHDGTIVAGPIATPDADYVYQVVVDNVVSGQLVEDIRMAIVGYTPIFCYLKYRPVNHRFANENTHAQLAAVHDVASAAELAKIARFVRAIGLEVGEIDVLRDRASQRLFVVDANNTPYGPPNGINDRDRRIALSWLSSAFAAEYLSSGDIGVG